MTPDYVGHALARTLGVPRAAVVRWEVLSSSDCRFGAPGMIYNALKVTLQADVKTLDKVLGPEHRRGSWAIANYDVEALDQPPVFKVGINIDLLYGKETQHIFKALYQMMTVRHQKRRKRK